MEGTKKLSMPSGTVHDIRYLYTVIAVLRRKGGRVENALRTFAYFQKAINEYNDAKASRYALSFKPREVNIEVVKHVVGELKDLKLVRSENGHLALTYDGENVARLIEEGKSDELKKIFTKLMLDSYGVFESFLRRLKDIAGNTGLPVPVISSDVFTRCGEDPRRITERYVAIVKEACPSLVLDLWKLHKALEESNIAVLGKRTQKIDVVQAIIERHFISEAFSPVIKSRRVYDFVRGRASFLELTNYAIFDLEGFPAEITYLTSDLVPSFAPSVRMVEYAGGSLYVNHPSFQEIRGQLKSALTQAHATKKDEFGYAKIADVRDLVCRHLKISDNLFDAYLKRLYEEEPHWLSFTYSGAGDIITEKRRPIVFEKPVRELFTMLRIVERR